ncbi:MAG: hypothetical protein E3J76_04595 [Candidatus Aminicenantes bacterium]|nr:MAG: hypothetical protein E3J76_04595 [Candidatus Aminicenantes bacterium]
MFIKWQSRKSFRNRNVSVRHCAYLVKNYREGNKVKQKVVSYLGSITGYKKRNERNEVVGEDFYPIPTKLFYKKAQKNLNKLNIPEKEKDKVLKTLSLKIPCSSSKEIKQAEMEFKVRLEEFKTLG